MSKINKLTDDCFAHDKDRLRHNEALRILKERMHCIVGTEKIALGDGTGRVLAAPVPAPRNIPAFDNSAVDGYAFCHGEHEATGGFFPITARIAAGTPDDIEIPGFSAARIFTGAPMPKGADTVVMQEDCETHEQDGTQFVVIPSGLKKGANCRLSGEDVQKASVLISPGQKLRAQELAAIGSAGINEITVFKRLNIGLLSNGDEILRPGEPFQPGKVFDANYYLLSGLLDSPMFEVDDLGICPDSKIKVKSILTEATQNYDCIISSGGASKGEEDHLITTLETLGTCHLWQLAVKPGRPMGFGQIDGTPCFVLPGNPVAAFVCFLLYVKPALNVLGGKQWHEPVRFPLKADFSLSSKPDRREFLRGFTDLNENGSLVARKFQRDGSGLITGIREATGLIEISEERTSVETGQIIHFIPFTELLA
ncbi:MAG: gephyrin-like molybdotransferase Glp [Pseudomonadota bacterium]